MLLRIAIVAVTALTTVAAAAQTDTAHAQTAPAPPLEAHFEAAERDPAQVVPLIFAVSAEIPRVEAEVGHALAERVAPFARRAFFSPEQLPGAERLGFTAHRIEPGELPGAIARRHHVGAGAFKYWNAGYDERRLAAGRELRVLELGESSLQVIIDRQRFRLALWVHAPSGEWLLAMYAPIGLGAADSPTPAGESRVTNRVRDPAWTHPVTREVFPPGHPENVLGGYWIALDSASFGGRTGIGLHGYTGAPTPDWIERGASNGCVRMLQGDVDVVFELALEGTRVVIAP